MLILEIKVRPQAGRVGCKAMADGRIVIELLSAPEKGKANQELIKFLSKKLCVAQGQIEIVSGSISRYKRVKIITEMSMQDCRQALGLHEQQPLFTP